MNFVEAAVFDVLIGTKVRTYVQLVLNTVNLKIFAWRNIIINIKVLSRDFSEKRNLQI